MARSKKPRRPPRDEARARRNAMAAVADKFESWGPPAEVLTRVVSVPTCFHQYDRATRVGGHPIQRVGLVCGPSNHGKTAFCLGLGDSFLEAGHFFGLIDAEHTTPVDWLAKLMRKNADHPGFRAMRPRNYEEAVKGVRELVEYVADAREKKLLHPSTSGLVVVDSVQKLTPQKLVDKILLGKDGFDGARGRAAMMKAALNSQWLNELVPLLYHTKTGIVFVTREYENADAGMFEPDYVIGGGRALQFESSLTMRVTRASWLKVGSKDNERVIGERHRVTIRKTKVGGKAGKVATAHFYTSNGEFIAEGFDHARGLLELCVDAGLVRREGKSKLVWQAAGEVWRTTNAAVKSLTDSPQTFRLLDEEARAFINQETDS